jgi:hypothetical protein
MDQYRLLAAERYRKRKLDEQNPNAEDEPPSPRKSAKKSSNTTTHDVIELPSPRKRAKKHSNTTTHDVIELLSSSDEEEVVQLLDADAAFAQQLQQQFNQEFTQQQQHQESQQHSNSLNDEEYARQLQQQEISTARAAVQQHQHQQNHHQHQQNHHNPKPR